MAKSKRTFDYQPPSFEETVDRAERKGSLFDTLFKDSVKTFKARQGANIVRILPPSWKGARHYGLPIKVHRGVGPDDRQYLCLRENDSSPHDVCPICQALYDLGSRATAEDKKELRPGTSMVYYVVDREAEKEGVQIWMSSPTTDSEIAAQSVNRRSKAVLDIVHPEDGYDLEFTRSGTTRNNTRYRGFQISRDSSPLSDRDKDVDEWLDFIFDNPLPTVLNFYPPDHMEKVFYGKAKETEDKKTTSRIRDEEPAEEERLSRRRNRDEDDEPRKSRDEEDERPARRASRDEEPEERPRSNGRVRLDKEEETPFDGGRRTASSNGHDEEDERPSSRRTAREEPAEEVERPSSRSRREAAEEPEERPSRRSREEDDERPARRSRGDDDDSPRDRMRQRIDRS